MVPQSFPVKGINHSAIKDRVNCRKCRKKYVSLLLSDVENATLGNSCKQVGFWCKTNLVQMGFNALPSGVVDLALSILRVHVELTVEASRSATVTRNNIYSDLLCHKNIRKTRNTVMPQA
jgi:hypothetical protein